MNNLEIRLCEPKAWEILELAARYYTEQSQDYTVSELIQAGAEAQIPDRFIRQAIKDLKTKQQQKLEQQKQIKRRLRIFSNIGLAIASIITFWSIGTYNHLTHVAAQTEAALNQLENQLQRRADLIPQLIDLTKTYAQHEQQIITQLIQARKDYLQAIDLDQKTIAAMIVNRSIDTFYRYAATDIKLQSSQLFINLQYEITGTENRIAVERMRYNQKVQKYNQEIDLFPQSLVAKVGRFKYL